MGGPRGAALLVFTPASMLACLLIHPTQCHRHADTRGLGLPKRERKKKKNSRTTDWPVTAVWETHTLTEVTGFFVDCSCVNAWPI